MMTAIALLPTAAVVALLATRRVSLLAAGCVGLALALGAAGLILDSWRAVPAVLGHALAHGGWIAWQAISVILAGLLLYQTLRHARPDLFEPTAGASRCLPHRWLFAICFLLGPFAEAATGFGVGYLITVALLLRLGLDGIAAATFGLFSQILVPWGALGIGTVIGAELVGISVRELGVTTAILSIPLLIGYLLAFWWLCRRQHVAPSWTQAANDLVWLAALLALLYAANRALAVDVAALASAGPLLVLRWWLDGSHRVPLRRVADSALPYAALTAILLLTRSVTPIGDALNALLVLRPAPGWPAFPLLYHASFWLAMVAAGYAAWQLPPSRLPALVDAVWRSARVPVLVTLVFMVMAEIMAVVGIPTLLAEAWVSMSQRLAVAATPLLAMAAGALTGSNAASNALLMALQVEIASTTGRDALWLAAVQNAAGSNATLFSPVRIAMGTALVALAGREGVLYARIWPLIAVMLLVLLAASALA